MLQNMRIRSKLAILVVTMFVLVAVVVTLGFRGMAQINASLKTVYEDRTICLVQLGTIQTDLYRVRNRLVTLGPGLSSEDQTKAFAEITKFEAEIDQTWKEYLATYLDPDEKVLAAAIDKNLITYKATRQHWQELIAAGDFEASKSFSVGQAKDVFLSLDDSLSKDVELQVRVAKQEYDNGQTTFETTTLINLITTLIGVLITLALSIVIVREITRSVAGMVVTMTDLAHGNVQVDVPGCKRTDEIGDMARAVEIFKINAVERLRLEAEEKASIARREARQAKIDALTNEFDSAVSSLLQSTSDTAHRMDETSQVMSANAEETQRQSTAVSTATAQASANVGTIASASNQMLASIQEIGSQVSRAATISSSASDEAQQTNKNMEGLASTAARIGEVVTLITDIASQTNLLALNATIEAARAGEAGKGFAVVANEVKSLANQTARATDEIVAQVTAVQQETSKAVDAIKRITSVIGEINEMSSAIAGAVEEQGAAMQEVVRNVEQAAEGTRSVAENIVQVVAAASSTGQMAVEVKNAAGAMGDQSKTLSKSVETFLSSVRAL